MGASNKYPADSTIEAGLPDIAGWVKSQYGIFNNFGGSFYSQEGANYQYPTSGMGGTLIRDLQFKASHQNRIYGNSSTVQPPAYCIYIWKRIS